MGYKDMDLEVPSVDDMVLSEPYGI